MIMAIITHSDMNHSNHERWSWILRANPDDDHSEDPGVDEVLDPVADGVDGEEASLEIGVDVPTQSLRFAQSLAVPASRKFCIW